MLEKSRDILLIVVALIAGYWYGSNIVIQQFIEKAQAINRGVELQKQVVDLEKQLKEALKAAKEKK